MRSQSTWLIVLVVALCSLHLCQATASNSLTDKDLEKKLKSTPKLALADDPRFNKMLPVTNSLKEDGKNSTEDDYYEEYYNDYDDDLKSSNKLLPTDTKHSKSSAAEATTIAPPAVPIGKLKPIKGDDKVSRTSWGSKIGFPVFQTIFFNCYLIFSFLHFVCSCRVSRKKIQSKFLTMTRMITMRTMMMMITTTMTSSPTKMTFPSMKKCHALEIVYAKGTSIVTWWLLAVGTYMRTSDDGEETTEEEERCFCLLYLV